ncbi:MAG: DUF5666 domain-containing protein [Terriglobales bacterium]
MRCFWQKWPLVCLGGTCLFAAMVTAVLTSTSYVFAQDKPSSSSSAQVSKAVGVIKSIQADSLTIVAESGNEVTAQLTGSTKILRVPPGEKDLKNATVLQAQDLQPGDRVLVRGQASADGHAITALAVIVMKQADVAAKHQQDLEDWQKRGVGGIVTKVDTSASLITISTGGMGPNHNVAVHVAKETILRRYAHNSVKFDDAKPAPLDQVKIGDQLRARGTRSADGSELSAQEVVTGSFRSIAGIVKSVDAASNTVTVQDTISKSAVQVAVSPDSQMWKLPTEMAQRIAMRLKATAGGANGDQSGATSHGQAPAGQGASPGSEARAAAESQSSPGTNGNHPNGNGSPDLQRMLSRLPNIKLADLQKGDVVYVLAAADGNSDVVTASKLVAGVEAILTAVPNRSASSLLSPWSLGTGGEGEAAP